MNHYFEAITNTSGDSLVGYFARVIDPANQNTVVLSADNNGTPISTISGVENMATTDANGNLDFYVTPGTYHLDIYAPNATSFIMRVPNVAMNSTKGDTGAQGDQGEPGEGLTDVMAPGGAALVGYGNRSAQDKLDEIVSVADFAIGGVVTVQSFRGALSKLSTSGGTLNMPRKGYSLSSADLATPLLVPDNVVIEGNGSIVTIAGTAIIASVFRSVNASNVVIRNMLVIGNSQATTDASSGAFFNYVHDVNGQGAENVRVENVRLSNFAAERWVSIVNSNASGNVLRGVRINNVSVISQTGNNLGGANIGIGSNGVMIFGVTAPILDVEVSGFYAEADYIKCGINIFHKVQGVTVNKPYIRNAGRNGTSNDSGAYAINVYGDPGELLDITINEPIITAPRSCGIYIRGARRVAVFKPLISGQTDTEVGTLPKAAIATNASADVTIDGGLLSGNVYDVMMVADTASTAFNASLRGVRTTGASNTSVVVNPGAGSGSPDGFTMTACDIDATAGVVILNNQAAGGRNVRNVAIDGGRIVARGGNGITVNPNGSAVMASYRIQNVYVGATNHGINADMATGDLLISNVVAEDAGSSQMIYGLIARNVPQLHIAGLLVRNMGTGFATLTDGANGTLTNVRQYNCVNGFSPNSMGMVTPTGTGTPGSVIEKLNPAAGGFTAYTYTTASAWKQSGTVAA